MERQGILRVLCNSLGTLVLHHTRSMPRRSIQVWAGGPRATPQPRVRAARPGHMLDLGPAPHEQSPSHGFGRPGPATGPTRGPEPRLGPGAPGSRGPEVRSGRQTGRLPTLEVAGTDLYGTPGYTTGVVQ